MVKVIPGAITSEEIQQLKLCSNYFKVNKDTKDFLIFFIA